MMRATILQICAIIALCPGRGVAVDAPFGAILSGMEAAREQAGRGAYDDAATTLGRLREAVATCGRPRMLEQLQSYIAQAEGMQAQAYHLAGPRPVDEAALLQRATLVAIEFGDPAAARFLLARRPASTVADACLPLAMVDSARLVKVLRWYESCQPATASGRLQLRWALQAALTELQARCRLGDMIASGYESKADALQSEVEQGSLPLPLTGQQVELDLVEGAMTSWDRFDGGLRNRNGQTFLPFIVIPDQGYALRLRLMAPSSVPCRIDLPLADRRILSLALAAKAAVEIGKADGGIASIPVAGLLSKGGDLDLLIRVVKTRKGMLITWKGSDDAKGSYEWASETPLGEVDSRTPGILVQGEVTIDQCRLIRLGASTFSAPRIRPPTAATPPSAPPAGLSWAPGSPLSFNTCSITPEGGGFAMVAQGGAKDKAAAYVRGVNLRADQRTVVFHLSNPTDRQVTISVVILPNGIWHETALMTIPGRGQHRVILDLEARNFRTQASNWEPRATLPSSTGPLGLALCIYNRSQPAKVLINGVSVLPP